MVHRILDIRKSVSLPGIFICSKCMVEYPSELSVVTE